MTRKVCVVITARPSYSRVRSVLSAIRDHAALELQLVVAASALLLLGLPSAPAVASGQGWSVGAPMPTCRSELGSAVLDGWVYVGGGLALSGSLADFQRYRPLLDRWERRAPLPGPLHHFGMAAAAGAVYVTGGYDSLRMRPRIRATWRYDPAAARWERMADMPGPRAAHAMVQLDGLLFVVGGAEERSVDHPLEEADPTCGSRSPRTGPSTVQGGIQRFGIRIGMSLTPGSVSFPARPGDKVGERTLDKRGRLEIARSWEDHS